MRRSEFVTVRRDDVGHVLDRLTGECKTPCPAVQRLRAAAESVPAAEVHIHIDSRPQGDGFSAGLAVGYEEGRRHGRR